MDSVRLSGCVIRNGKGQTGEPFQAQPQNEQVDKKGWGCTLSWRHTFQKVLKRLPLSPSCIWNILNSPMPLEFPLPAVPPSSSLQDDFILILGVSAQMPP